MYYPSIRSIDDIRIARQHFRGQGVASGFLEIFLVHSQNVVVQGNDL
jgi:hypothetical protein